tara:strand:- start:450 stop:1487 length:1038 start_codon:yes stop_codon:yes gene_type:complete
MFILGFRGYILRIVINKIPNTSKKISEISKIIPDISKKIYSEDIVRVLENRYSTMGPIWVSHQMDWCNGVYASFKDHDKFLIIIFLIKKTLDFYSSNFTKLDYNQFYSMETVEIERFNIKEISLALNIPKESTRRKVLELRKIGAIRKNKKKIIIDRSKFFFTKPENSIKRVSRFLTVLSDMCEDESVLPKKITSEKIELVIKKNFSYIWKLYYEVQIPMMIRYKKIFEDLDTFHIFGTCVVNQHLYVKKLSKNPMGRDEFIKSIYTEKLMQGINAMSISDITGIPRATVVRKLKLLLKRKVLTIDEKKHYRITGNFIKILKPMQKDTLIKLGTFASKVYNFLIL